MSDGPSASCICMGVLRCAVVFIGGYSLHTMTSHYTLAAFLVYFRFLVPLLMFFLWRSLAVFFLSLISCSDVGFWVSLGSKERCSVGTKVVGVQEGFLLSAVTS